MTVLHWPATGLRLLMVVLPWRSVLTVMVDGVAHLSGAATHGCLQLIDLAGVKSSETCDSQHLSSARLLHGWIWAEWRSVLACCSSYCVLCYVETHWGECGCVNVCRRQRAGEPQ